MCDSTRTNPSRPGDYRLVDRRVCEEGECWIGRAGSLLNQEPEMAGCGVRRPEGLCYTG